MMSLSLQIVFMVTSMDRERHCNENMNTGGVIGALVGGISLTSSPSRQRRPPHISRCHHPPRLAPRQRARMVIPALLALSPLRLGRGGR
jgi:hypothetical protein